MVDIEEKFNTELGLRIQYRRKLLGYNAKEFAQYLGISQQQLYKYEAGADRVSAMKICEMSKILKVPISYFFEAINTANISLKAPSVDQEHNISAQILDDKETRDLLKHYISIRDVRTRLAFVDVIKSVSKCIAKTTNKGFFQKFSDGK